MITFMVGPPGSGKTLISLQRYVLRALKEGRKVYHNIRGLDFVKIANHLDLDPYAVEQSLDYMYAPYIESWAKSNGLYDEYTRLGANKFESKHYKKLESYYKEKVSEILLTIPYLVKDYLVVLDEAQNFIGANDHKEEKNIRFFEYATTHRQHGHELLIVTQHEDNVDVKIRRISNLLIYLFRRDVLGLLFKDSVKERHYAGCSSGTPELLTKFVTRYDKRLFKLYNSYVEEGIVERRKFRSIWLSGTLLLLLIVFLVCVFGGVSFVGRHLSKAVKGILPSFKPVVVAPVAPEFSGSPSKFLGEFKDYWCGDRLYVLRLNGGVDSLPTAGVPLYVCPYENFQYFREVKK